MSRFQDLVQRGTRASQPVATAVPVGALYGVSDEVGVVERSTGAAWQSYAVASSAAGSVVAQGRVSLTTAVPYLVSTVTAATTIYYTPAVGNRVPLYDGSAFTPTTFAELSQTTTDNTKSPAAVGNNLNYDLFVWTDAGTIRCTRGPAWTSDTGRGTGAGTTQLTRTLGVMLNTVDITNGPAALRGTYVGTVRSNGSAQIDFIVGGAGGAGGEGTILGFWNMYNRQLINLVNFDNTDSWGYTLATYRLKNAAASAELNKIKLLIGLQGDGVSAVNTAVASNSTAAITAQVNIGVNSTSTPSGSTAVGRSPSANNGFSLVSIYSAAAPLGFNYLAPLEFSNATGTQTWFGDGGVSGQPQGIFNAQTMF